MSFKLLPLSSSQLNGYGETFRQRKSAYIDRVSEVYNLLYVYGTRACEEEFSLLNLLVSRRKIRERHLPQQGEVRILFILDTTKESGPPTTITTYDYRIFV